MRCLLALVTLCFALPAEAALQEIDLLASGDGLLTRDTATGLDWLDVTATVGQSYDEILTGEYVESRGFRFASETEVEQLWRNAGAVGTLYVDPLTVSPANFDAAVLLIDSMGCTSDPVGYPCDGEPGIDQNWHIAMYGDPQPALVYDALIGISVPPHPLAGSAVMWLDFGWAVDPLSRPDVGGYLVRPVPEPTTAFLLACGLAGLAVMGRRRSLR